MITWETHDVRETYANCTKIADLTIHFGTRQIATDACISGFIKAEMKSWGPRA